MSADSRTLRVRCAGLEENGTFPLDNTGRGRDLSPAFAAKPQYHLHLIPALLASNIVVCREKGNNIKHNYHADAG